MFLAACSMLAVFSIRTAEADKVMYVEFERVPIDSEFFRLDIIARASSSSNLVHDGTYPFFVSSESVTGIVSTSKPSKFDNYSITPSYDEISGYVVIEMERGNGPHAPIGTAYEVLFSIVFSWDGVGESTFTWDLEHLILPVPGVAAPTPETAVSIEEEVPLPVNLLSFDALYDVSVRTVKLAWETASEKDNDYFEVLRSENGETFSVIGIIEGKGTTAERSMYGFEDRSHGSGGLYYRLRQVDYDGSMEEFKTVFVSVPEGSLLSVASGMIRVETSGTLEIANLSGAIIATEQFESSGGKEIRGLHGAYIDCAVRRERWPIGCREIFCSIKRKEEKYLLNRVE